MDTQYYTYDLPASSDSGRSNRPYRRARSRRRRAKSSRRKGLLVLLLAEELVYQHLLQLSYSYYAYSLVQLLNMFHHVLLLLL